MQKGLGKAEGLVNLTPESLQQNFAEFADGSGALRSPITSAKYFNQSMRGLDLGKDNPMLKKVMNEILDTEIQGLKFGQWGDPSKDASKIMKNITQDQLKKVTRQLNQLGERVLQINQALSDKYAIKTESLKLENGLMLEDSPKLENSLKPEKSTAEIKESHIDNFLKPFPSVHILSLA